MAEPFAVKGYVLNRQRIENGSLPDEDYFERLLAEICEYALVSGVSTRK